MIDPRGCAVSKHTICAWKSKYGGMDVSEAQEVKQFREEDARLKELVADLSLDKDMLQSALVQTGGRQAMTKMQRLDPIEGLLKGRDVDPRDHHFACKAVHELQTELAGSGDHDRGSGESR
jgi:hypothetical protein